jgi:hypothetical protein
MCLKRLAHIKLSMREFTSSTLVPAEEMTTSLAPV